MMKKSKKYFIALDTDSYKLNEDVVPVNLNWSATMDEWTKIGENLNKKIKECDVIIGYSVGAAIALLTVKTGDMYLYSPSPIFKEVKHLLTDKMKKELGNKVYHLPSVKNIKVKVKAKCYLGEKEDEIMYKTFEEIKKIGEIEGFIIKGANHNNIINHSGVILSDKD